MTPIGIADRAIYGDEDNFLRMSPEPRCLLPWKHATDQGTGDRAVSLPEYLGISKKHKACAAGINTTTSDANRYSLQV